MFEKVKKPDEPKRLELIDSQNFGEVDTKIVMDSETGVSYMIVRNTLGGGIAVTPLYDDVGEILVEDLDEEEDEDEDEDEEN